MATPKLYPLNALVFSADLKQVSEETGELEPMTSGTVTGFIANSNSPTATAVDPTLTATCAHVGSGKWRVEVAGDVLTAALLASAFATATPYLIIQEVGGFRVYVELDYDASRAARVT